MDRKLVASMVAVSVAASVPVALLAALLGGRADIALLLVSFALSFPICMISILLYRQVKALRRRSAVEEEIVDGLYSMLHYGSAKAPLLSALRRVSVEAEGPAARRAFGRISARVRLGEEFGWAADAVGEAEGILSLRLLRAGGGEAGYSSIRSLLDSHEQRLSERKASVEESIQRYATMNMFLSTVLPSFAIFGFMGDIILDQGGGGLFLFAISMLLFMPFTFLLGNAFIERRLHG